MCNYLMQKQQCIVSLLMSESFNIMQLCANPVFGRANFVFSAAGRKTSKERAIMELRAKTRPFFF